MEEVNALYPGKPVPQEIETVQTSFIEPAEKAEQEDAFAGYELIGVAFDTYILLQNKKQILLIDQHAAHERILYERLMREVDIGGGSQLLLVPLIVHVTPQDAIKLETYKEEIKAAGYDIEPFGETDYQIRAVPNVLGQPETRAAFLEMVDHLGELRVLSTRQKRRDAILQMACKKAVKGGDKLSDSEISSLLKEMQKTGAPPTCPHGRPLVVVLSRTEIEKKFRRIND
jgi:DNA mismatch repair protein MutL